MHHRYLAVNLILLPHQPLPLRPHKLLIRIQLLPYFHSLHLHTLGILSPKAHGLLLDLLEVVQLVLEHFVFGDRGVRLVVF